MKTPLEDDHELDRLFRDKLAGEEATPPAFVWNEVERKLHPPHRRPAAWKWWLSGALLLLLSAGGWWWTHMPSSAQDKNAAPQLLASSENKTSANDANEKAPSLPTDAASQHSSSSSSATSGTQNDNDIAPAVSSSEKAQVTSREKSVATNEQPQTANVVSGNGNAAQHNAVAPANHANVSSGKAQAKSSSAQSHPDVVNAPFENSNSVSQTKEPSAVTSPEAQAKSPENALAANETQAEKVSGNTQVSAKEPSQTTAMQNEPAFSSGNETKSAGEQKIRPVLPSDTTKAHAETSPQVKLVFADTTKKDSSLTTLPQPVQEIPPAKGLPFYFVGVHASLDNQKIASGKEGEASHSFTDIDMYSGDNAPLEINTSSTSYGGRAGYFVTQHFAVLAGGNYSILEVHSPGRFFGFNHNNEYTFTFHSATAAVQLPSSAFTHADSYGPQSDSLIVHVTSVEKYAYLHFQLGGAWYPVRKRYFGVYINALSNGAFLQHQQLTLTSVRTGNTFAFSGDGMRGMKRLTLGAQFGAGFEFTPVRNLGIWIEPAYFLSGAINPENAFIIRPAAMRFQAGLLFHF